MRTALERGSQIRKFVRRRFRAPARRQPGAGGAQLWSGEPARACGLPASRDYGRFCAVPWRATAPGPGRSAAESTSELKVNGMQKMLTSLAGLAGPPVVSAPAGAPVSTIVRARSLHGFTALVGSPLQKAPEVRCPQLTKPVTAAQSVFAVHATGRHGAPLHAAHGTPTAHVQAAPDASPLHRRAKVLRLLFLQKPQNTLA